jgi:two-component system chemotaxis response regulator CheB
VTSSGRVRVLVVDDSAFARRVLRQALEGKPDLEVVGIAGDGLEALEKIALLKPDVVTLDLMMPELDGLGVLRELAASGSPARVVVVSISGDESEVVVSALQLGAVDFVNKPTALATDRLHELADELVLKVRSAARARPLSMPPGPSSAERSERRTTELKLIVIGTSTGGPQALTRMLAALPGDLPVPVAVALHIPGEYTEALAHRLDQACELRVTEASEGLELRPGSIVLAKGGVHLSLERVGARTFAHLVASPEAQYVPSVDLLFQSAAAWGNATLGVVLTGMGNDGCEGARAIVAAGGKVLTEAEESCVVYGMPRSVFEAGLSDGQASLEDMAAAIVRRL